MHLYVNGELQASRAFAGPLNHTPPGDGSLKIGNGWTLIDVFNGFIDEVRLSDSVRYSDSFVPVRRFVPDVNTRALWHLDTSEATGITAVDSSTGNNDGTVVGAVWIVE